MVQKRTVGVECHFSCKHNLPNKLMTRRMTEQSTLNDKASLILRYLLKLLKITFTTCHNNTNLRVVSME